MARMLPLRDKSLLVHWWGVETALHRN